MTHFGVCDTIFNLFKKQFQYNTIKPIQVVKCFVCPIHIIWSGLILHNFLRTQIKLATNNGQRIQKLDLCVCCCCSCWSNDFEEIMRGQYARLNLDRNSLFFITSAPSYEHIIISHMGQYLYFRVFLSSGEFLLIYFSLFCLWSAHRYVILQTLEI